MADMSKKERVLAALRGEDVDHVPVSAWWHDYAHEWSANELAAVTIEYYSFIRMTATQSSSY